jgi:outer membrane protein assembly factor BamB
MRPKSLSNPRRMRVTRPTAWSLAPLTLALLLTDWKISAAGDWPQWRGPAGTSVSEETRLPVSWSEKSNIAWKCPLPEWGTSTPAIWGDAIFLTTQQDDELLLLRIETSTGRIVWTERVGAGAVKREGGKRESKFHRLHNMASPSPVTDGELVVAHFGNGDLAVYHFDGQELWRHNLQQEHGEYTIWWGHANSPVLYGDLVISVCMQDSLAGASDMMAESYLVAHDKRTGQQRWKTLRMTKADAEQCDSYTTPLLHTSATGTELIIMGGNQVDAYDPATGRQRWRLPEIIGGRTITGPTIAHGMLYVTQGMRGPLLAVKLGKAGELSRRDVAWDSTQSTPDSPCPVVWGDLLFTMTDNGIAKCYDAHSGQLKWHERVPGDYKASPLAADGRIYFLNTEGLCTVVAATDRFEVLARNQLDDETIASPAVSDGRLYLRGRKALYCIGK